MTDPVQVGGLRIRSANRAMRWDLEAIFGTAAHTLCCHASGPRSTAGCRATLTRDPRPAMPRASTAPGKAQPAHTGCVVTCSEGEPVASVAAEPRAAYPTLRTLRMP
jgi:hypothetical protein